METLGFCVIGLAAGWLAGKLTKGRDFGLLGDLAIGVIGSLVGGFLFGLFGLSAYGVVGSLITATAGAVVLLLTLRWLRARHV